MTRNIRSLLEIAALYETELFGVPVTSPSLPTLGAMKGAREAVAQDLEELARAYERADEGLDPYIASVLQSLAKELRT